MSPVLPSLARGNDAGYNDGEMLYMVWSFLKLLGPHSSYTCVGLLISAELVLFIPSERRIEPQHLPRGLCRHANSMIILEENDLQAK